MKAGIYIHIPFCRIKCDYCSFYSIPINNCTDIVNSYIDSLLREIDFIAQNHPELVADTVYFGGGTPSILEPRQIGTIINHVSEKFKLQCDPEITIEINPDDLSERKLDGFLCSGINRIVLGVQSLNPDLLERIGRRGRPVTAIDLEMFFSRGNFTRCIDIITGIPGQTCGELFADLENLCVFKPEHISLYLLSVDDSTPLGMRFTPDDIFEKNQVILWDAAMKYLKGKGYVHYEISNYSLPGYESRHNSKYWDFTPYVSFGPGAHSFFDNKRYSNNMNVMDYINSVNVVYNTVPVTTENKIVEFIMTSLRRIEGFTYDEFSSVTGLSVPEEIKTGISAREKEGMLHVENGRCFLSEK